MKPWLMDEVDLNSDNAAQLLFVMTLTFFAGFMTLGIISERLFQLFDIRPISFSVWGMTLFLFIQGTKNFCGSGSPLILVLLLGFYGIANVLVYAGYAQIFPKYLLGRVSTILNLLTFICAFILQWGVGVIIDMWPATKTGYAPESYQGAFAVLFLLQAAGLIWYFLSLKLSRKQDILI